MEELAKKIQIVMNTLQTMEIQATFNNMNKLMGSLRDLAQVRDELEKIQKEEKDEQPKKADK